VIFSGIMAKDIWYIWFSHLNGEWCISNRWWCIGNDERNGKSCIGKKNRELFNASLMFMMDCLYIRFRQYFRKMV
jgi:hypothetical protein